ncbi:MAG: phosphatase PAP2 family protein [Verrucomicrobiota bacterium]
MLNQRDLNLRRRPELTPVVTEQTAVWLVVVVLTVSLMVLAFRVDDAVTDVVRANAMGWSKRLAVCISFWGDFLGVMAIGGAICGYAWKKQRRNLKRLIILMMLSAVLSGAASNVLRAVCGRTRPFAKVVPGWYGPTAGTAFWCTSHAYQSFPSSHTAVVAGFLAPLALRGCRIRRRRSFVMSSAVALVGTSVMAWARVWNGSHHVSDVLASAILGLVMGVLVLRKAHINRWLLRLFRGASRIPAVRRAPQCGTISGPV